MGPQRKIKGFSIEMESIGRDTLDSYYRGGLLEVRVSSDAESRYIVQWHGKYNRPDEFYRDYRDACIAVFATL